MQKKNVKALLIDKRGLIVGGVTATVAAGNMAGAQAITYAPMVNAVNAGMVNVINDAGPLLFGFIAVIGGFYFVWGRIRSLW
jgi:hypothetical protein